MPGEDSRCGGDSTRLSGGYHPRDKYDTKRRHKVNPISEKMSSELSPQSLASWLMGESCLVCKWHKIGDGRQIGLRPSELCPSQGHQNFR